MNNKRIILFIVFLFFSVAVGCSLPNMDDDMSDELVSPSMVKSEYFTTLSTYFQFEIDAGKLRNYCTIILGVNQSFTEGAYLEVAFENPADRSNPLVVEKYVAPRDIRVEITSPEIKGLKTYELYDVVVTIYTDKTKTQTIGEHIQKVRSLVDESL